MGLWRGAAIGGVAVLGVLGGCSDDEADPGSDGLPGSPIRDGFEVVEGSEMMGPAFPPGEEVVGYVDDGFRAIFEVTGDPKEVLGAYVEQARALGLTSGGEGWVAEGEIPIDVSCGGDDYSPMYRCSAFARTPTDDEPRSLSLLFSRHEAEAVAYSHLEMRYSTLLSYWDSRPGRWPASLALPPVPGSIRPPADADRLFEGWETIATVGLADGGRIVAEMPNPSCVFDAPLAVVEVSEDPEDTLEDQVAQFAEVTGPVDAYIHEPLEVEGGRLLGGSAFGGSGSYIYSAHLYDTEGQDWMLVETCSD